MKIIYNKHYDFKLGPFAKVHHFDAKKYSRAMYMIRHDLGQEVDDIVRSPERPVSSQQLSKVHSEHYLEKLNQSSEIAKIIEVSALEYVPNSLLQYMILTPKRWGCAGTILAAETALKEQTTCFNIAGGYHHAKPDSGEGFSIYSDIALAINHIREHALLAEDSTIAYIDLDVHLGNGVNYFFMHDDSVKIFDMFNSNIYPMHDTVARGRIDFPVYLKMGCGDETYLRFLTNLLPQFLNNIGNIDFAIYNAGTDVLAGDPLGGLNISAGAVLERDLFVLNTLRQKNVPTIMLSSGGYTKTSAELIAKTVTSFFNKTPTLTKQLSQ